MRKLPKSAKRVFKGVLFDVYQWPQKMFDGSIGTYERAKRNDGVVIIPAYKNKIAVIRQRQPHTDWFLSLPAGQMDKGDISPRVAALRELREETGLKPKRLKFLKMVYPEDKLIFKVHFFIAQDCEKVGEPTPDRGEKISVRYYSFEQFLKLSDNPNFFMGLLNGEILRARFDPKFRQSFKKAIFG